MGSSQGPVIYFFFPIFLRDFTNRTVIFTNQTMIFTNWTVISTNQTQKNKVRFVEITQKNFEKKYITLLITKNMLKNLVTVR